jgi:hypothetical protein
MLFTRNRHPPFWRNGRPFFSLLFDASVVSI